MNGAMIASDASNNDSPTDGMVKLKLPIRVTHVIFDLDGLLLETESVFLKVNNRLLAKHGKTFSPELRGMVTGMTKETAVTRILEHEGLSGKIDVKDYCKQYDKLSEEELPKCEILPGAMRIIRHLHSHNVPMAICTGSNRFEFELKTRNHPQLLELISTRVLSGDDPEVRRSKPAPDPFLVTMKRFQKLPANASDVLVFEDSTNGVLSALAAGTHVVMVPDLTFMKVPDEVRRQVTIMLKSLEDFKPENVGFPPY